jgi:hypothetical protein
MNLAGIEQAKRASVRARLRFESTLAAAQARMRPKNLAGEAWDGVKEKSNELADGALEAVKRRPVAVSAALGALALFLAREPLKRAATRLISGDGIDSDDAELVETAAAAVAEGVS